MKRAFPTLSALIVAFTAYQLRAHWLSIFGDDYLFNFSQSLVDRPFVYRALLPLLSQAAESVTGWPAEEWIVVLVVLSAVGFYFALRYFMGLFLAERVELLAFLGAELLIVLIIMAPYVYDIPTAFTFALAYIFLARRKWILYLALFPVATLNRETTFLLLLVWAAWAFFRMRPWAYLAAGVYQVGTYLAIRALTASAFSDHAGADGYLRLWHNLDVYGALLPLTLVQLALLAVVLYFALRGWARKPIFLRTAFLALFPLQLLLYLLLGEAFEIRVFVEAYPILWTLCNLPVTSCLLQKSQKTIQ